MKKKGGPESSPVSKIPNAGGKPIPGSGGAYSSVFQRIKHEALCQSIIETMQTGVAVLDLEGNLAFTNDAIGQLTGYSTQELAGQPFIDFIHPGDRPELMRVFQKGLATDAGLSTYIEFRIVHRDGSVAWLYTNPTAIKIDGCKAGFSAILQDITTHKRAQKAATIHRDLSLVCSNINSLADALNACLEAALNMTEADGGGIYLIDPCTGDFNLMVHRGLSAEFVTAASVYGKGSPQACIAMAGLPVYSFLAEQGIPHDEKTKREGISAIAIIPTMYRGEVVACLNLGFHSVREIPPETRPALETLSTYVGNLLTRIKITGQLLESEHKYETLVEKANDGVAIVQDGVFQFINKAACDISGYRADEMLGMPFSQLLAPQYRDLVENRYRSRLSREDQTSIYGISMQCKDGTIKDLELSASLIDYHGRPATMSLIRDITERQKVEDRFNELNKELGKKVSELQFINSEMGAFSYSVSHDMTAPLRRINSFSLALQEDYADRLDGQGRDYLARIRKAGLRMNQQIDDMLSLARVTSRVMTMDKVDLSAHARRFAAELAQSNPARKVDFIICDGLYAMGDANLLECVVENLLRNAWKFSGTHEKAKIEFGSLEQDGKQVFFVRDDGVGFDMTFSKKLFTPFQRMHKEDEFPGNGIGLATVKRIIRRHYGEVWLQFAVEQGTTAYFTLSDDK
jgi:PAS domain S-box-containing protein